MISIIIPVKDPEPFLLTLIDQIHATYFRDRYEILIQKEKGLGYAVMCGVKRAKGEIVVVMDSDGSHPASSIPVMVEYAKTYPIVIGSRYCGGLSYDTLPRKIISRVFCKLAQTLFRLHVRDNMSGFIAAQRQVFLQYPIKTNGFKFGLSLLVASRKTHYVVTREYPIVFEQRKAGKSKASPKEALRILWLMLQLFKGNA